MLILLTERNLSSVFRAKKFVINNDREVFTKKKVKVNRFAEACSQKKKRQGTASSGLTAYETNPYAFYQTPQAQPRISRKMRVKTPNVNSSKGPRRSGTNADFGSKPLGESQPRATTAVGISEFDKKNDFVTPKGRRFLGSAHPGKRTKLRGKLNSIYTRF